MTKAMGMQREDRRVPNEADKTGVTPHHGWLFVCTSAFLLSLLMIFLTDYSVTSAQTPTSTCSQPADLDVATTFCDAANDDVADEYPTLEDVSIDITVPPVLLKAIGGYETSDSSYGPWAQCIDGSPYNTGGCAWGIMQIYSGMDCVTETAQFDLDTQQAVKYDYRYNIAMGTRLLVNKWHARFPHQKVGDGNPSIVEDWYYTVWAYNGWGWKNNPNNSVENPCPNWPQNPAGCAYQDKIWWWAAHPPSRGGGPLMWSAVDLTRIDKALLPDSEGIEPWNIPAPTPTHRDFCRTYLPIVMKDWTSVFLFDTFNPINAGWVFYTGDTEGEYGELNDYVRVYTADGHDDTYSLFITEQVGTLSYPSGAYITLVVPPGISPLTLSCWYKRVGALGGFHVLADGQLVSSGSGSSTWQRKTADISVYAADGQVTLDFRVPYGYGGPHALLFDEITVSTQ